MRYVAGLVVVVAACTSATGSTTSTLQTAVPDTVGLPCISTSGEDAADTNVTVKAGDREIDAVLGWISAEPCSGEGAGVVSDGFFAGVEEAVLAIEGDDAIRVHAAAFDQAHLEATWNGADGSESPVDVTSQVRGR
jgi:hypothetical protein